MVNQTSDTYVLMNQLILNALESSDRKALACFITNRTSRLVQYDKASLWDIELYSPTLLAVSGQECGGGNLDVSQETLKFIHRIDDKEKMQVVSNNKKKSLLWVPIQINQRTTLGLLLERAAGRVWTDEEKANLEILTKGYGYAWKGSYPQWTLSVLQKIRWIVTGLVCLIILSIIPVATRISAPCEVVAEEQVPVTAPFDGVIQKIVVESGDLVTDGQLLFSYDKDILMQELKEARERLENAGSQGHLDREKIHLQLLQERLGELSVKSDIDGVAKIDDKEQWQGRGVLAGEHVLSISDPTETKLRIFLPESREIVIAPKRPIKVYLDGDSGHSYDAQIININADNVVLGDDVVTFTAEAIWKHQPEEIHVGERGVAILYGQNVPLIYWLFYMPFSSIYKF